MFFSKKWKYYLLGCLFLFACKSTDCGCPMAEQEVIFSKQIKGQENIVDQKEWKIITKNRLDAK